MRRPGGHICAAGSPGGQSAGLSSPLMGGAATVSSCAIGGRAQYFCASSGLKVGHSLAACDIERHRSVVVHDQPIAVELLEAEGAPDPHQARRCPVLQRAAEPAESVPESHIITHGDGQVANLIVHILEERERPRPVLQLRLYPYMLERRLDVEGHDVRCVQPPQAFEIFGLDSFHDLVNLLPDLGFVFLASCGHRYPSLPIGVESWLLPVRQDSYRECEAPASRRGMRARARAG